MIELYNEPEYANYVHDLYKYMNQKLNFSQHPRIVFDSLENEQDNIFCQTGNYNPDTMTITLFTSGRHPKDILRSLSHELIHHHQNCQGNFDIEMNLSENYAQENPFLREMEEEAYLKGNMLFRDWEDSTKTNGIIQEDLIVRRKKFITENVWKSFGFSQEFLNETVKVDPLEKFLKDIQKTIPKEKDLQKENFRIRYLEFLKQLKEIHLEIETTQIGNKSGSSTKVFFKTRVNNIILDTIGFYSQISNISFEKIPQEMEKYLKLLKMQTRALADKVNKVDSVKEYIIYFKKIELAINLFLDDILSLNETFKSNVTKNSENTIDLLEKILKGK